MEALADLPPIVISDYCVVLEAQGERPRVQREFQPTMSAARARQAARREHVVEVGGVHGQLVRLDADRVQPVEDGAQLALSAVAGDLQRQRLVVAGGLAQGDGGGLVRTRVGEAESHVSAGDEPLQLVGAPLGGDLAVIQYRDTVGELVGLLQVLGGEEDGDPPPVTSSRMICHMLCRERGSRPVVCSSRKMIHGSPTRIMAMSRRRFIPPEKVEEGFFAASVRSNRSRSSAATRRRPSLRERRCRSA